MLPVRIQMGEERVVVVVLLEVMQQALLVAMVGYLVVGVDIGALASQELPAMAVPA